MAHCVGGIGPTRIDPLTAMRAWVERGTAPESLIATGEPGQSAPDSPPSARKVCHFPKVARWSGKGEADRPEQFTCE